MSIHTVGSTSKPRRLPGTERIQSDIVLMAASDAGAVPCRWTWLAIKYIVGQYVLLVGRDGSVLRWSQEGGRLDRLPVLAGLQSSPRFGCIAADGSAIVVSQNSDIYVRAGGSPLDVGWLCGRVRQAADPLAEWQRTLPAELPMNATLSAFHAHFYAPSTVWRCAFACSM